MIAKCLALLAIVAQINGYVCNSNCATGVVGTGLVGSTGVIGSGLVGSTGIVGSGLVGTTGVVGSGLVGSGLVGSTGVVGSAGVVTGATATSRNIVAKGKYPVALENTGPVPDGRVPVSTSHVQAPVQEKPTVRLPARIPAPRTVAHSCTCYKQILRPRVHDQYITVPTVQRYIETLHKPVVENIQYEAIPVNCESSGVVANGQYASSGLVSSGLASSGLVSSGLTSSGLVSSGLASSGLVSSGLVSSGLPVVSSVAQSVPVRSISSGCGCGSQGYY